MALEIITNYLPVNDDMDFSTKLSCDIANNNVKAMAKSLEESKINELDPKDGRKVVITLTADLEKGIDIKREFILPQ